MPQVDLEHLARDFTDRGRLIEAGWIGLRSVLLPQDMPELWVEEMRNVFFAGARHLFTAIITILDSGTEPTQADLARMELIHAELEAFIDEFSARHLPVKGSA